MPHLKSTVGLGVFEEMAACVCACMCFCRSVLILYPYLQICPCCLSDPRLFSHLISPSFCSPNTLQLCSVYKPVCVFCGLLWQKYCEKQSVLKTANVGLPLIYLSNANSRHKRVKLGSIKRTNRCTDERLGTFFPLLSDRRHG